MPTHTLRLQRRARQVSAGLVVLCLHLALGVVWWTSGRGLRFESTNTHRPSIAVWLPALTEQDANKATPKTPTLRAQVLGNTAPSHKDPTPPPPQDASVHVTTATAVPNDLPAATAPATTAAGLADVQPPSTIAGAAPLNLSLSRKAITAIAAPSFAEQSAFHKRPPDTVERQIAMAAGETGPWTEERIDNDHIRWRRGNTCITTQRPRAAMIDPMNEAMARLPWHAGKPVDCR